jgi:hypothetical protein
LLSTSSAVSCGATAHVAWLCGIVPPLGEERLGSRCLSKAIKFQKLPHQAPQTSPLRRCRTFA